ncbi:MAG: aminomethyl-transferring glycine dehydrogenase [Alphaproteobacteria bacterium]|nr:aminomethyl-transferring glycine dehydrogenase [Alphaproteobacteria bacterium]
MNDQAFVARHVGPRAADVEAMLATLGLSSLDELVDKVVPAGLRLERPLDLPPAVGEHQALARLAELAGANKPVRAYLGMGYHGTLTPGVILRNVLENPGWYTAYTPYQAEIAQGRLEALLVFQMMVQDLTGLEVSNASLLDEATAAAEAMAMCHRIAPRGLTQRTETFFVDEACHPQTVAVTRTRAEALGWTVVVGDPLALDPEATPVFGALVQDPASDGRLRDLAPVATRLHATGAACVAAVDLLALTLRAEPAAWGADIAIGSSQRFGVPMGYGGPHAAFLACSAAHARKMPGRIIGVTIDAQGRPAYRMALQTREQHIRRAKATSNVCTAQVLLAVVAAMYTVWHGPEGLRAIAERVHGHTARLARGLAAAGLAPQGEVWFDTVTVQAGGKASAFLADARARGIELRDHGDGRLSIALDETVTRADVDELLEVFGASADADAAALPAASWPAWARRTSAYLQHPVFSRFRSETEMLRYLHRLESRDLSLTSAMIPLGSCTMKLNATAEMEAVTWPGFGALHPFVPRGRAQGYATLLGDLERWLAEITGFHATSLQPNAGSQGEYAGLLVIRAFHQARGEAHRTVCLIPTSAHGTNPASAVMAGMEVVEVRCDDHGNVDVDDLAAQAEAHADRLAALMVTYPSTHGVFEEGIRDICAVVHRHGGQVYLDGANLNALVGICRPGDLGADVCHLNLHKTFCIPHGGGGPGMGPIAVKRHLAPFLPGHPVVPGVGGDQAIGPVSAAPYGSPSILPISWAYIAMMGADGLAHATKLALLAANYVAKRLEGHFEVLYTGRHGFVAHECILDARAFKDEAGVSVDDIAKRLMDYGFHGPTMSWPVAGTLMVEPTESESKAELDRFCDAMIAIRAEIRDVAQGRFPADDNPLHHAPHTAEVLLSDAWDRPYGRELAAYPAPGLRRFKQWPTAGRVDNVYGDKNLRTSLPDDAA